jgi:hypothetical protein
VSYIAGWNKEEVEEWRPEDDREIKVKEEKRPEDRDEHHKVEREESPGHFQNFHIISILVFFFKTSESEKVERMWKTCRIDEAKDVAQRRKQCTTNRSCCERNACSCMFCLKLRW